MTLFSVRYDRGETSFRLYFSAAKFSGDRQYGAINKHEHELKSRLFDVEPEHKPKVRLQIAEFKKQKQAYLQKQKQLSETRNRNRAKEFDTNFIRDMLRLKTGNLNRVPK